MPGVDISVVGGIAEICLAQPQRKNAISIAMWQDLADFAGRMRTDNTIRAVLVRGEGDNFSAGADISEFASHRHATSATGYDDLVEETCQALEAIPQPVVAWLRGHCIGAGLSLAASCDLRLAMPGASLRVPAARLGLGYDPRGIARLIRVFGPAVTRRLLLTAQPVDAEDAAPAVAMMAGAALESLQGVRDLLAGIAACAPLTLRAAKQAIRAIERADEKAFGEAVRQSQAADRSADYAEGRAAYLERRQPRFIGA